MYLKIAPVLVAMLITSLPQTAGAVSLDNASLEFGTGARVRMVRLAVQSDFESKWFVGNGRHLSGYWDASLAQWRGSAYQNIKGQHQNITNIGLKPVFRYQRDDGMGWYAEGGIGVNLLSERYDNDDNRLSTLFQFSDHIGGGYVFPNQWEVGMKIEHFSNGGIKSPNSGANFLMLKVARPF